MIVEAVLHANVDGASERVETIGGIVRYDRDRLDRGGRYQVPIDGIAECFVDANPVLIDRQSLRRSRYGRADKTAKLDIGLKWISGDVADVDPRHILLESVHDIQGAGALDFIAVDVVDACRNLVGIDSARFASGVVG